MKSLKQVMTVLMIAATGLAASPVLGDTLSAPNQAQTAQALSSSTLQASERTPVAPNRASNRKSITIKMALEPCVPPDQTPGGATSEASIDETGAASQRMAGKRQGAAPVARAATTFGAKRPAPVRRVFCVCITSPEQCEQYQQKQIKTAF